jgi:hypothetical protein
MRSGRSGWDPKGTDDPFLKSDCKFERGVTPQITLLLQERQIERPEHENNSDVHYQPRPEPVPQGQDVHADHDDYQREHVKHDGCLSSHPSFLPRAAGVSTTLFNPIKEKRTLF